MTFRIGFKTFHGLGLAFAQVTVIRSLSFSCCFLRYSSYTVVAWTCANKKKRRTHECARWDGWSPAFCLVGTKDLTAARHM